MAFDLATRKNAKLRLAIDGTSGSGKTYGALVIAGVLGGKIGVLDSETGSASLYAGAPGIPPFGVEELEGATIQEYLEKITMAAAEGIDVLIVDSYSHSWMSTLEAVDRAGGWAKAGKTISPLTGRLVKALQSYPGHVIATMRSKTDYAIDTDAKTGKVAGMRKIGVNPIARPDTEYEFTVMLTLDREGGVTVSKSRCGASLPMDQAYSRNDLPKIAERLKRWLAEGAPVSAAVALAERIRFAQSREALKPIGDELRALKVSDPDTVRAVLPAYKARIAEFEGAEG